MLFSECPFCEKSLIKIRVVPAEFEMEYESSNGCENKCYMETQSVLYGTCQIELITGDTFEYEDNNPLLRSTAELKSNIKKIAINYFIKKWEDINGSN